MKMPLVSFVIPAYNTEKFIERTLKSLTCQTLKDFEIIIIDDGSTDKTVEKANKILEESGFFNYFVLSQPNSGVSSARNKGLKLAKGEYVIFLDSDDYVSEKLVEKLYNLISKDKPDIVFWKFKIAYPENENSIPVSKNLFVCYKEIIEGVSYSGKEILRQNIVKRNFSIHIGSGAYKREFLISNNLYFPINFKLGEDLYFIFSSLYIADNVKFIDSELSFYVQHRESTVRKINESIFDACLALNKLEYELTKKSSNYKIDKLTNEILLGIKEYKLYSFIFAYLKLQLIKNRKVRNNIMKNVSSNYPKLIDNFFLEIKKHKKLITKRNIINKFIFRLFQLNPTVPVLLAKIFIKL